MSIINSLQLTTINSGNKTKYFVDFKKTILRPLIQLAVKSMEQEENIDDGILEKISVKYKTPQEKIDEWYRAILLILKFYLRSSDATKITDIAEFLREQKMENECIDELCGILKRLKNPKFLKSLSNKFNFFPTLKSCKWRTDIAISSSYLSRILEPTILMEWKLSSGECYLFELNLTKFHLLRHTVAEYLLKLHSIEDNLNQPKLISTNS